MDKKALIAIGVIAVLGIGTYAIIVGKNNNKSNSNTGGIKNPPNTSTTPTKNESLLCKYLNFGCGASSGRIDL
jgi:hypothetical protein